MFNSYSQLQPFDDNEHLIHHGLCVLCRYRRKRMFISGLPVRPWPGSVFLHSASQQQIGLPLWHSFYLAVPEHTPQLDVDGWIDKQVLN